MLIRLWLLLTTKTDGMRSRYFFCSQMLAYNYKRSAGHKGVGREDKGDSQTSLALRNVLDAWMETAKSSYLTFTDVLPLISDGLFCPFIIVSQHHQRTITQAA